MAMCIVVCSLLVRHGLALMPGARSQPRRLDMQKPWHEEAAGEEVPTATHAGQRKLESNRSRRRLAVDVVGGALGLAAVGPRGTASAIGETVLSRSVTYMVVADSSPSLRPSLELMSSGRAVDYLSRGTRGVFLGEHHDASADHMLQAALIRSMARRRRCCVGLEAVQVQFQGALDAYIAGEISAEKMRDLVQWDTRWVWPFERYVPVFEACRQNGCKLLALNVDSEDLARVETGGYENLDRAALESYVPDTRLFTQFATTTAFKEYVRYVIEPSYDAHQKMGVLKTTITGQQLKEPMPFVNFFSGRMLWDCSMANRAAAWARANPDGLFVGLVGSSVIFILRNAEGLFSQVGADHVKFGCGVPARFALALDEPLDKIRSILLNPTPFDTCRDIMVSEVPPFTLQLRFAERGSQKSADARQTKTADQVVLPLADLLWLGGDTV